MDEYSQLKPAWHPDRIDDLRAGRRPKPVHVQLILSDLCNQDCGFCAYRMSSGLSTELFGTAKTHNPNRQIATEKAIEILDDCAALGVKAIQFTGGGEPTVHRDHLEIFAHAQHLGMDTALVTNGVRLEATHPAIQAMAWIRISIDAGTPESYSTIRRVSASHWGKVWSNLEWVIRAGYEGVLGVGFVVTPDNYHEIGLAAERAKIAGAKNMRVGAVFSEQGLEFYGETVGEIHDFIAAAKAEFDGDGFEVIDLFGRRLGDLSDGSPTDPVCSYQYLTVYIGGDLSVYRCCNTAYTRAGTVGSLIDQRFVDAWPALVYEPFDARTCRFCQFLGQNRVLNGLSRKPNHENFV